MAPEWLLSRVAESPAPLRGALRAAVEALGPGPGLPEELLDSACQMLEDVRSRLDEREAAFDLLVADGLLTLACEAAALADPDGLADRCQAMGPSGALGRLAESWVERS